MAQDEHNPDLDTTYPLNNRAAGYVDVLRRFETSTDTFENALREAHDTLWWRQLVQLFKLHYEMAQEDLSMGMESQREEDKTRGFIRAMKLILAFDIQAETLVKSKKQENEQRRRGNGRREERPDESDF